MKRKLYHPKKIFLETLTGYLEAAKVKLLTEFSSDVAV